jgi:hypothetical protein
MSGEDFEHEVSKSIEQTDDFAEETMIQVLAIEEVFAARWPRSMVLRWRLGRELRRSVAHVQHGTTFAEKRLETIGTGWLVPPWRQR